MDSRKATIISFAVIFVIVVGVFIFLSRSDLDMEEYSESYIYDADDFYTPESDELYENGALNFTELSLRESSQFSPGFFGDFITTQTDYALYLFSPDTTAAEKTELVMQAELILSTAQDVYNMQFLPGIEGNRIYFAIAEGATRINLHNGDYADVVVSIADSGGVGALLSFMSRGKLPAWLCAGLEHYWLSAQEVSVLEAAPERDLVAWNEQRIERGLPDFGDVWFVPGLIEDDLSNDDVIWIAYEFVKYISETGQLAELIALYMNDETVWEAEHKVAEAWNTFSGVLRNNGYSEKFLLRYLYNSALGSDHLSVRADNNNIALFNILGRHASHYFIYADWWTLERALEYVSDVANAIEFSISWFDVASDNLSLGMFTVVFHTARNFLAHREISDIYDMRFNFDVSDEHGLHGYLPFVVSNIAELMQQFMHEAQFARAAFGLEPIRIDCPTTTAFDRVLPELLRLLFMEKIGDSEFGRLVHDSSLEVLQLWSDYFGRDYVDIYRQWAISEDKLDMRAFVDTGAIVSCDEMARLHPHLMQEPQSVTREAIYSYIGQYEGALEPLDISFLWFLLDNGTRENFLRVCMDISLMEEVYGRDIDEMTRAWLAHLFR